MQDDPDAYRRCTEVIVAFRAAVVVSKSCGEVESKQVFFFHLCSGTA